MLCDITGFAGVSLQPNAGSQGEYAGLLVIQQVSSGAGPGASQRMPDTRTRAHGTNPASAAMVGMKIVVVNTDEAGNIDVADLKAQGRASTKRTCRHLDGHVPVHAWRFRGSHCRDLRHHPCATWRAGLHGRREHERDVSRCAAPATSVRTCATSTCTKRSASRTAAAGRAWGR